MDEQHKKLIGLVNTLYNVLRNKESSGVVKEVLEEMAKYAEMHLKEEEAILKNNDYPEFTNHLAMHQGYLDKVKTLMGDSEKDEEAALKDAYVFLRHWWMEHIVTEDNKYGEFLQSKGVK